MAVNAENNRLKATLLNKYPPHGYRLRRLFAVMLAVIFVIWESGAQEVNKASFLVKLYLRFL